MASQPVSRGGSNRREREQNPTRRTSSSTSNTNVFSDDYALESPTSRGDTSPVDSIQDSVDLTLVPRQSAAEDHPETINRSIHPATPTVVPSPSTAKRPLPADSASIVHRATPSVASSRLSMPRPHSPYNGPTAPSQPYAMYPQVTRASSIASESTVRPPEQPFVSQGGPEHPYALYQNTVPEEDDEASPSPALVFPAASSSFQGSRSSGNDTGDIVGTDGHVESLPPYTRYADNVVAKGDMGEIDPPTTAVVEAESTSTEPASGQSSTQLTPVGTQAMEDAEARKEGWRTRAKRRKCCGVPCWIFLAVCGVFFIAAALGGIIGGVIGNKQGEKRAEAVSSGTTTVWLDADPVATDVNTPPCPTGHFTMFLNQTEQIEQCILNPDFQQVGSWDCMDVAALGISVFDEGPDVPHQIVFDDYSLRPQLFRYGPQPPDFNRAQFNLTAVKDKHDGEWGVAMFFSSLFDKLVILGEDEVGVDIAEKRSLPRDKVRRGSEDFEYIAVGDSPWYCFWNETVAEFWIYLEKDTGDSSASTTTAAGMSMITSTPSYQSLGGRPSSFNSDDATHGAPTPVPSETEDFPTSEPTPWDGPKRRSFPDIEITDELPNLIKMVEKRKPNANIQPYCQLMTVKPNWEIVPQSIVPPIYIEENEYAAAESTGNDKRWTSRFIRRDENYVEDLGSMCICEWMNG